MSKIPWDGTKQASAYNLTEMHKQRIHVLGHHIHSREPIVFPAIGAGARTTSLPTPHVLMRCKRTSRQGVRSLIRSSVPLAKASIQHAPAIPTTKAGTFVVLHLEPRNQTALRRLCMYSAMLGKHNMGCGQCLCSGSSAVTARALIHTIRTHTHAAS